MHRTHFIMISLVFVFITAMTTRIEADGSQRSVGLHHWVKGNECYRSEDWECTLSSWTAALSVTEFIEWQEPKSTLNGMFGLAQVAILTSKNCAAANSLAEIATVKRVISDAAEDLSELGRLPLSPAEVLAFVTPSLDVCSALICKSTNDEECMEERLQSLNVSRLEELDFLGLLPSELATSDAVAELILPFFDSR
ncbi:hypothetical protein [Ruegeria atlantica]|uniref:hypothetical protein n=1 Tax=Ruegeria atlantica TaxID=81569 RepID=UPI001479C9CF|nr:hypothetical protein [Ruegeria atlantica]